jgi:homoserine O-acetyltransferase
MPDQIPEDSIGIVTPQMMHFDAPLALACGRTLEQYDLIYETYGELNADKSNAILICHALSSDHHAAGYHSMEDRKPGWWEACIGPGKVIDTNHFMSLASTISVAARAARGQLLSTLPPARPTALTFLSLPSRTG